MAASTPLPHCRELSLDCGSGGPTADARAEIALVRSYGADEVVERGEGFAAAIRRVIPDGVDALALW